SGLLADGARPTIVKTRYLAGHQQLLRSDHEKKSALSPAQEKEILKRAEKFMNKTRALLLSDYGKGFLTPSLVAALVKMAKDKNIPVIVDPKGRDFSLYAGADVITPNKKELAEASNLPAEGDDEVIAAAK